MRRKIISIFLLMTLIIASFSGCTEIDDVPESNPKDSGGAHWYHYLNPDTIRLRKNNEWILYDYSSEGLRSAIDNCQGSSFYRIHIPEGNLTAYGKHHGQDYNFYIDNISNLTIYTDGLNFTRFLVFEDRTVFGMSNITNCHFNDFNFTLINNITSDAISFVNNCSRTSIDTIMIYGCYSFCNCSDFWYQKIFDDFSGPCGQIKFN